MKTFILLVFTFALFNQAICQSEYVGITTRDYAADQDAVDSFNNGWQILLQEGVGQNLFSADDTWSNVSPSCIFKKTIDNGFSYYFLGEPKNENGDTVQYLIFVDYLPTGPNLTYYSYYFQDKLVFHTIGEPVYVETVEEESSSAAPATVVEDLAPQEEIPQDFEVPAVAVVEEENGEAHTTPEEAESPEAENAESSEVGAGTAENTESPEAAEVEIEVELEADANPLAGYIPIDISSIENYPQGQSAVDEGAQLAIQDLLAAGSIPPGDWTRGDIAKAYLQTADNGIQFYFAVTITQVVNGLNFHYAVEYYVFQDANGVNQLESYKLGASWTD